MSYPSGRRVNEQEQRILVLQYKLGQEEFYAMCLERVLAEVEVEAEQWRNAHASVVAAKRRLSAKYGAIMSRKPSARWRRTKKRVSRSVTKVTHKLAVRGYRA